MDKFHNLETSEGGKRVREKKSIKIQYTGARRGMKWEAVQFYKMKNSGDPCHNHMATVNTAHLKMVNFMLCGFYNEKNRNKAKSTGK